jgi:hypothetical protein
VGIVLWEHCECASREAFVIGMRSTGAQLQHLKILDDSVSNIHCAALTWPPSDYHLFGPLKKHPGGCRFHTNAEVLIGFMTVAPLKQPRVLCCWHTCIDNMLWQMPGDCVGK